MEPYPRDKTHHKDVLTAFMLSNYQAHHSLRQEEKMKEVGVIEFNLPLSIQTGLKK
jgi:hypothetical protein